MRKIVDFLGGNIVKDLLSGLDNLLTSKEEKEFWELLKIGIGGYVVGRSAEKIAKGVTISRK